MPAQQLASEDVHMVTENSSPSTKRLEGKVAVVTGGARGIGEATVRLFASHGAKVVIADIIDSLGMALSTSLDPSSSSSVTYIHCDVSQEEDVKNLVTSTISLYGKLDLFFNNAAILGEKRGKYIMEFDEQEFDKIMRVNIKGVALGTKHAARVMVARRSGSIISTSSVAGVLGGTATHAYTASKHAVVGLTKNVAWELGKYGIRVNCISPFGVATPMMINATFSGGEEDEEEDKDVNQVETVEEYVKGLANLKGPILRTQDVAQAALFLASDESMYISGHNLVVDGGFSTSKDISP